MFLKASLEIIEGLKFIIGNDKLEILLAGLLKDVLPKKAKFCKDKVKWCESAIDKKDKREVLYNVNFNSEKVRIEATDGKVIFIFESKILFMVERETIEGFPVIENKIPKTFNHKLFNFEDMYTCIKSMTVDTITFNECNVR